MELLDLMRNGMDPVAAWREKAETKYALKFTRGNGAPYLFVYDSEELKRAQRMLHLLKLFGFKDATLNPHRKR